MFQNQVRMHAWHLIINHCIYFFGSLQEETLMHSNKIGDEERIIVDDSKESWFWTIVDFGTTRRTRKGEKIIIFKPCHQEERHRAIGKRESPDGIPGWPIYKIDFFGFWLKEIARRDLIISAPNKRNRPMRFQVVWDRQRDLVCRYLSKEVARRDLVFHLVKRNCQMGFQVK